MKIHPPPAPELGALLDTLCPMHAILDATGHVQHAGPTLKKLYHGEKLIGNRLLEVFELRRPRISGTMKTLRERAGTKLHFAQRRPPNTELKGVLVSLPADGRFGPANGAIVNLSFGISVIDAVRDYALTSADFAATDLTVEMLFLVEAKSAAMEASRKLNLRLQGARIAAEEQAYTDTLTGLKNRRAMDYVLGRLGDTKADFALMHVDLDHFKAVNDSLGHAAGDHVLKTVARILVEETRGTDTIIRTGGDEFVLIFDGLRDHARVAEIAMRLIDKLEQPILFEGQMCRISGSIGAVLSRDYKDVDIGQMMNDADTALYAAKNAGRGRHQIHDPAIAGADVPAKDQKRPA